MISAGVSSQVPSAMNQEPLIAYFSMEIAMEPGMPTYCGGLGLLAGDLLPGAADRQLASLGVSPLHPRR